ncbi:MAG: hypothetical protein WCX61_03920, partial [Candidatus Peribacteraceae bacterium]
MRIVYALHTRFPTEKAHGIQVLHVCTALSHLGHDVTLVAPSVRNNTDRTPWEYYGIPESFHFRELTHFDPWEARWIPGSLKFLATMVVYGRALRRFFIRESADLLYTRSPLLLRPLLATNTP